MGSDRATATAWESALQRALRSLRFGSVEILVHDGRVVQVETRERVRFGDSRPPDDRRRNQHHDAQADRNTGRSATPSEENIE
jgi:hypothetical protein